MAGRPSKNATWLGGGVGTLIVLAANLLPASLSFLREFLLYIAPGASVVIANFAAKTVSRRFKRWALNRRASRARKARDRALADPHSTPKQIKMHQENVAHFEKLLMKLEESDLDDFDIKLG